MEVEVWRGKEQIGAGSKERLGAARPNISSRERRMYVSETEGGREREKKIELGAKERLEDAKPMDQ
jgi:hypothetical protein